MDSSNSSAPSVSLTKRGQTVSLAKAASGVGPIRFNLNWDQTKSGGLFGKKAIDLDLGCLYELEDGTKGVVQALGNSFGSLEHAPFVHLDGDDRSGANSAGENLLVSAQASQKIRRLAVFAYIYEGAKNWSKANAVVTIHPAGAEPITIPVDAAQDGQGMCGICIVTGGADGYKVERHVEYVKGHRELDTHFGWGMTWRTDSK